jgi:hypothetical protein
MTDHIITMHTTDERDRLWVTCSCGWNVAEIMVTSDNWRSVEKELWLNASAHVEHLIKARR